MGLWDKNLFNISEESDTRYTSKVGIPQYLPKNEKPLLYELYNDDKYKQLISDIEHSSLPEDEKAFLRLAATRHIVFRYDKIADYYAHSTVECQSLMEDSALVLIDLEDAIEKGYAKMSKVITHLLKESKENAG